MRKALLVGGNDGELFKMENSPRTIYGFEHMYHAFDPDTWEVWYIGREIAFYNPNVLRDFDVALVIWEWHFFKRPEVDAFLDAATLYDCKIGCQPNGPFSANVTMTSPQDTRQRSRCDFMIDTGNAPEMKYAQETIHGIPYFGCGSPIGEVTHKQLPLAMEEGKINLPEDIGERFLMGHVPQDINWLTIILAERMGIPLIVNWSEVPPLYQGLHDLILADGGYKHVVWRCNLNHVQWLYMLQHSRGLFYMSQYPSGGRPQVWAALAGKVSIATMSGWQANLCPETSIEYGYVGACFFEDALSTADAFKKHIAARLALWEPKPVQARMDAFLAEQGWS